MHSALLYPSEVLSVDMNSYHRQSERLFQVWNRLLRLVSSLCYCVWVGMHLKLRTSKTKFPYGWKIRFAVVDIDKSDHYPQNFICGLPALNVALLHKTAEYPFLQFFGQRSSEVARALLKEALNEETDLEVIVEIERRLKLLEAKTRG